MKQRKIPLRKSVVSGEMKPKKEMVRITRSNHPFKRRGSIDRSNWKNAWTRSVCLT